MMKICCSGLFGECEWVFGVWWKCFLIFYFFGDENMYDNLMIWFGYLKKVCCLKLRINFIGIFDLFLSKIFLCFSVFFCLEVRIGISIGKVLGKFLEKKVWVMYDRLIV